MHLLGTCLSMPVMLSCLYLYLIISCQPCLSIKLLPLPLLLFLLLLLRTSSTTSSMSTSTASHWLAWSSLSSLSSCRLRWLASGPSLGPAGQTCLVLLIIRDLFSLSTPYHLHLLCLTVYLTLLLPVHLAVCLSASSLPAPFSAWRRRHLRPSKP